MELLDHGIANNLGVSVERNNITITARQSMVDKYFLYALFEIQGEELRMAKDIHFSVNSPEEAVFQVEGVPINYTASIDFDKNDSSKVYVSIHYRNKYYPEKETVSSWKDKEVKFLIKEIQYQDENGNSKTIQGPWTMTVPIEYQDYSREIEAGKALTEISTLEKGILTPLGVVYYVGVDDSVSEKLLEEDW